MWLFGAPDLIAQMLDKIVENAVDFSPKGETIEIGIVVREGDALLTVSNVGPQLPETMQGQLFESMISVRDRAETVRAAPHLGLGLFMVRLIAEFHRAKAAARNRPEGDGVVIEVTFPLAM
jgi:signal transduction histidine kinase